MDFILSYNRDFKNIYY